MEGEAWAAISDEARDFVSRCLTVDIRQRATLSDCLAHPWLNKDMMQVVELVDAFTRLQVYRSSRRESRSKAAAQMANRCKRKRENSVASDEGSAGSLTPTPSKNFKAIMRDQFLPSTAEVSISGETLDVSLSDAEEDAALEAPPSSATAAESSKGPSTSGSKSVGMRKLGTAAAAFTAAGLLGGKEGRRWRDVKLAGSAGEANVGSLKSPSSGHEAGVGQGSSSQSHAPASGGREAGGGSGGRDRKRVHSSNASLDAGGLGLGDVETGGGGQGGRLRMSDDGIVRNRDNVQSANSGSVEAAVSPPSMAAGLSRAGAAARSPLMSPQLPGVMDTLGRESPYIAGRLAGIALEQLSLSSSFDCAPDAARRDVGDAHAGAIHAPTLLPGVSSHSALPLTGERSPEFGECAPRAGNACSPSSANVASAADVRSPLQAHATLFAPELVSPPTAWASLDETGRVSSPDADAQAQEEDLHVSVCSKARQEADLDGRGKGRWSDELIGSGVGSTRRLSDRSDSSNSDSISSARSDRNALCPLPENALLRSRSKDSHAPADTLALDKTAHTQGPRAPERPPVKRRPCVRQPSGSPAPGSKGKEPEEVTGTGGEVGATQVMSWEKVEVVSSEGADAEKRKRDQSGEADGGNGGVQENADAQKRKRELSVEAEGLPRDARHDAVASFSVPSIVASTPTREDGARGASGQPKGSS